MPSQDEALNDRSSMPPVSVTMQPRNLPAVDAEPVFDDDPPDEPGLEALAHPAASSVATVTAATALMVPLTVTSFNGQLPDVPFPDLALAARRLDPFTSPGKN